jgi:hypothetical protein
MPTRRSLSRREFAASLAGLAATPLALDAAPIPSEPGQPKPSEAAVKTTELLLQIVRARYGKHITEEQMKIVERSVARIAVANEQFAKLNLENGLEPAFAFSAEGV